MRNNTPSLSDSTGKTAHTPTALEMLPNRLLASTNLVPYMIIEFWFNLAAKNAQLPAPIISYMEETPVRR